MCTFTGRSLRFALLAILIIEPSCQMLGESAFKVKGRIISQEGKAINKCTLEVFLASNDKLVDSREISVNFEESFVIAPKSQYYYMKISCVNCPSSHRIEIYELGNIEYYKKPIDLGEIVFAKCE
jgi:hypothetical protein